MHKQEARAMRGLLVSFDGIRYAGAALRMRLTALPTSFQRHMGHNKQQEINTATLLTASNGK
jgi:hypothetical protein